MEYTTEHNSKGGFRFDIRNPPDTGTEMKTTGGEEVIFDEVSFAGMLACTRKSDGSQQLYFPHDLVGANAELRGRAAVCPVPLERRVMRREPRRKK